MTKEMIKKILKYAYIVIFMMISLAPLGLFVLCHFASSNEQVNIEKREVKSFPAIYSEAGINESFDDECEEWLNQNIPFRAELLSNINVMLSDYMHNPTSNVVTGSEGWIYSEETINDYMNTNSFSDDELKRIAISLSIIEARVSQEGGNFLFVAAPNKNSIYPEYMPERYIRAGQNNLVRLYEALDKENVNYANLIDALLEVKADTADIGSLYYKRDTHWTPLGALIGYKAIMEGLGKEPSDYDISNVNSEYSRRSDLDKLLYPAIDRKDKEYIFDTNLDYDSFEFTYPAGVTDTKAQLENFMSDAEDHDNNFTTKKYRTLNQKTLYMVRDSFGRALLPFMIADYERATFVRSVTPSFENITEGEDVVYEICERNLNRLIQSAPFAYAIEKNEGDILTIFDSSHNICFVEDEGYAYRVFGLFDATKLGKDGRIYVRLNADDSKVRTFEAFPIYEEELLTDCMAKAGNDSVNIDKQLEYGFSLYIDKKVLDEKDYKVAVASGNHETQTLAVLNNVHEDEADDDSKKPAAKDDDTNTEGRANDESNEGTEDLINYIEEPEVIPNPYADENIGHQLSYRGCTIGIGDNIYSLKSQLGDMSAPAEIITSCLTGVDAAMYYYPGITMETDMDGNIYYISLMDNSYDDGKKPAATESGIGIGSDKMDIWDKLGDPLRENDKNCIYQTEHIRVTYSYKSSEVTSVILEDRKYCNDDLDEMFKEDEKKEESGVEYQGGNTYMYDTSHQIQTGWKIIDGQYYFFDRLTGERVVGQVIDGINIGPDGEVYPNDYEKVKIATMMKANEILMATTSPSDTMEEKRRKVFDWVLSFPYHQYRKIKDCYNDVGIEIIEANDIFVEGAGDCVSESAALAFLFHEIGYNEVYWVHDTGHSWVRSDDKLYDPLFAEARDFNANYDAPFKDYRKTMEHSMKIY